jgi:hypothetical protein
MCRNHLYAIFSTFILLPPPSVVKHPQSTHMSCLKNMRQPSEKLVLLMLIVQNSKQIENTMFLKIDWFPYSGEWRKTPTLLGPLEKLTSMQ